MRQIQSWSLSDFMFAEVFIRLREHLGARPTQLLVASMKQRGGMHYSFEMVDPQNRFLTHYFRFRIYYHADEETLIVDSGIYRTEFG